MTQGPDPCLLEHGATELISPIRDSLQFKSLKIVTPFLNSFTAGQVFIGEEFVVDLISRNQETLLVDNEHYSKRKDDGSAI
jgi:hypothetical protein